MSASATPDRSNGFRRAWFSMPLRVRIAVVFLIIIFAVVMSGDLLAPHVASRQSLGSRLLPPGSTGRSGFHLLGTDALGRDILSLIVVGARPAAIVSAIAVAVGATVGIAAGCLAGYRGGRATQVLTAVSNVQLAFPLLLLAITVIGILRPSIPVVVLVMAFGLWVPFARISCAETMQLRQLDFIEAVRIMQGSRLRILGRHVLPNILPSIVVLATFMFGSAIILESGLSFVGLGIPTRTPTWGRMLSEGRDYMQTAWWLSMFPGLAIFLLVLSVNLIGEWLRDALDPKRSGR